MRDLIGDLLDVARIETGTLSVTPVPSEVADVVDEARSRFLGTGGRDNLDIDLQPDLPAILADRRRIVQVLGNLMSNSARHSPDSSTIRVSAVVEDFHVAFSVSDDGKGIPAERMPLLFRKLPPTGDDLGIGMEGSGLGLAICKGIVEAHGGRIWAESRGEGLGARFTFTIPVAQEAGAGPVLPTTGGRREKRGRERVLVVDDDPQMLRYIRNALTEAGYEAHRDRGPGGSTSLRGGQESSTSPTGPDAARHRRHRADEGHSRCCQHACDLPVRIWTGGDHRPGLRHGRRRLHGQTVLSPRNWRRGSGRCCAGWWRRSRRSRRSPSSWETWP